MQNYLQMHNHLFTTTASSEQKTRWWNKYCISNVNMWSIVRFELPQVMSTYLILLHILSMYINKGRVELVNS